MPCARLPLGDDEPVTLVSDEQRRRRLARRHALSPGSRARTVEDATRAVVVLHATEPATVYLSLAARVGHLTRPEVDRALYAERCVVKQLAMRRTLFVFPRDLLPATWGSAAARTAAAEGARLAKDAVRAGVAEDGEAWVAAARGAVLGELDDTPEGLTAAELRELVPHYSARIDLPSSQLSLARVLTHLGATGHAVRGVNTSHWRVSRSRWTSMSSWLGDTPPPWGPEAGWAELVRRWLGSFGPGTTEDLVWWLGATKSIVRTALHTLDAVEVTLENGRAAWLLPDDLDEEPAVEPWAALLPVLDPTVMGWKERRWYLGEHASALVDRNGNAGTTAWWGGRVVGCWVQDPDGVVVVHPLEELPDEAPPALEQAATRLTAWLAGERVGTVYPSPAMKAARAEIEAGLVGEPGGGAP